MDEIAPVFMLKEKSHHRYFISYLAHGTKCKPYLPELWVNLKDRRDKFAMPLHTLKGFKGGEEVLLT